MNKKLSMPEHDEKAAIEKWKEFHKQVHGENSNEYLIPIECFSFNENGRHANRRVGDRSGDTSKKVMAIVL